MNMMNSWVLALVIFAAFRPSVAETTCYLCTYYPGFTAGTLNLNGRSYVNVSPKCSDEQFDAGSAGSGPCDGTCYRTKGTPLTRGCVVSNIDTNCALDGIECCEGALCNDLGSSGGGNKGGNEVSDGGNGGGGGGDNEGDNGAGGDGGALLTGFSLLMTCLVAIFAKLLS